VNRRLLACGTLVVASVVVFFACVLSVAVLYYLGGRRSPPGPEAPAGGRFRPTWLPAEGRPDLDLYRAALETALPPLLDELGRRVVLPADLPVVGTVCGRPNAFYDPGGRRLIVCYEMPELVTYLLEASGVAPDEGGRILGGQMVFVLLHEIGHALIDLYDLPAVGREEDAVDQFATFLLLRTGRVGQEAAFSAASFFALLHGATAAGGGSFPWWDEHSLDAQRYYNILCWVYGADPAGNARLVQAGYLPAERAARCRDETQRLTSAWTRLLGPRLR